MDEILQKLLSSELLSEDAKAEISTQWTTSVSSFKQAVREEVSMEVRSELAEQWAIERDALVEKVDSFVAGKLLEEIAELKADIEGYRDLQADYAEKLVEEKHTMAEQLAVELDQLIDKMDAFFEMRLTEEMSELKEDLEIVKQNEFGRKLYEAFASTYQAAYVDEKSVQSKLNAQTAKLEDAMKTIAKLEESQSKMVRESKMEKILAPLSGKKREQMQFVLANVETARLEEAYNHFIGRVLKEESEQKPAKVLNESTVVVTGETGKTVEKPAVDQFAELRKLAGI
jgi:hypothetical protein